MEMAMLMLFNNSRQAVGTSVGYARVALFKEHCDENKIYRYQYLGEKEIDPFMLKMAAERASSKSFFAAIKGTVHSSNIWAKSID